MSRYFPSALGKPQESTETPGQSTASPLDSSRVADVIRTGRNSSSASPTGSTSSGLNITSSMSAHHGPYSRPSTLNTQNARYSPYTRKPINVPIRRIDSDEIEPHLTSTAQRMIEILKKNSTPVADSLRKVSIHSGLIKSVKPNFKSGKLERSGPPVTPMPYTLPLQLPVPPKFLSQRPKPSQREGVTPTELPKLATAVTSPYKPIPAAAPILVESTEVEFSNYDSQKEPGGGKMKTKTSRVHEKPTKSAPLAIQDTPAALPAAAFSKSYKFANAWTFSETSSQAQGDINGDVVKKAEFWDRLFSTTLKVKSTNNRETKPSVQALVRKSSTGSTLWTCPNCLILAEVPTLVTSVCSESQPKIGTVKEVSESEKTGDLKVVPSFTFGVSRETGSTANKAAETFTFGNTSKTSSPPKSNVVPVVVDKEVKTWICPTCDIVNKINDAACVCCTEPRPASFGSQVNDGVKAPEPPPPPQFAFGFGQPISTSTVPKAGTCPDTSSPSTAITKSPTTVSSSLPPGSFRFGFGNTASPTTTSSPAKVTETELVVSSPPIVSPTPIPSSSEDDITKYKFKPFFGGPRPSLKPVTTKSSVSTPPIASFISPLPIPLATSTPSFGFTPPTPALMTISNGPTAPTSTSISTTSSLPSVTLPSEIPKSAPAGFSFGVLASTPVSSSLNSSNLESKAPPPPAVTLPSAAVPTVGSLSTSTAITGSVTNTNTIASTPATTNVTTTIASNSSFGAPVTSTPGFAFGSTATPTLQTPLSSTSSTSASSAPSTFPNSKPVFQFGNSPPLVTSPTSSNSAITTSTTPVFTFGASQNSTAQASSSGSSFTNPTSNTASAPFSFGLPTSLAKAPENTSNFTFGNTHESLKRKAASDTSPFGGGFQFNAPEPKLKMRAEPSSTNSFGGSTVMKTGSFLDATKPPVFGTVDRPDGLIQPAPISSPAQNMQGGFGFSNPNTGFQFPMNPAPPPPPQASNSFNVFSGTTSIPNPSQISGTPFVFGQAQTQPSSGATPFTPNLVPNFSFSQNPLGTGDTPLFTAGASSNGPARRPIKRAVRKLR